MNLVVNIAMNFLNLTLSQQFVSHYLSFGLTPGLKDQQYPPHHHQFFYH
jgi:hypothetical protein